MASSARLLGRVRAALGRGDPAPLGAKDIQAIIKQLGGSENALRVLPPPGYVLTSSGILVPHTQNGLTKVDRCLDRVEDKLVERIERGFGLFFRLTSVAVGTSACAFLLRLSWKEHTASGALQKYIPSTTPSTQDHDQGLRTFQEAKRFTSQKVKSIVAEVTETQLIDFNSGLVAALQDKYSLVDYVDKHVLEHRQALEAAGLKPGEVAAAQWSFLNLITYDAKWRLYHAMKKDGKVKQTDLSGEQDAPTATGPQ